MRIFIYAVQAARYDDLDDLKGLESAGVSLDAKDSQRRTGMDLFFFFFQNLLMLGCINVIFGVMVLVIYFYI